MRPRLDTLVVIGATCLLLTSAARAADTIETWERDAFDIDLYAGVTGLARTTTDQSGFSDLMVGYGVATRFSAFFGTSFEGVSPDQGVAHVYLGAFGTPIDTDHFDLDLILLGAAGTDGPGDRHLVPTIEVNLDGDPRQRTWGIYLRLGLPCVWGHATAPTMPAPVAEPVATENVTVAVAVNPGLYVRLAERHQLLLEHAFEVLPQRNSERRVEVGTLACGYNVELSARLELITQLSVDLPQGAETTGVGLLVGLIATLPPTRE